MTPSNSNFVYIGKRSKIFNSLKDDLPWGQCLSLNKAFSLLHTDFFLDKIVILFSLPDQKKLSSLQSLFSYQYFIDSVRCHFFVNISSTCVFAETFSLTSRYEPFYYKCKLLAHKATLSKKNGVNLVVGIFDSDFPSTAYPFTNLSLLSKSLNHVLFNPSPGNYYAFILRSNSVSSLSHFGTMIRSFVGGFSLLATSLDIFYKFIGYPVRSYTYLSNKAFAPLARIGDGSFGYSASLKDEVVFRSNQPNILHLADSFGILEGKTKIGLDQLRHGVEIIKYKSGFKKRWNLSLRFRNPFKNYINIPVYSASYHPSSGFFRLETSKSMFFSKKLVLASGPLSNTFLCSTISKEVSKLPIYFSDHAIVNLGTLSIDDAVNESLISKKFFLLRRNHVKVQFFDNKEIGFMEARLEPIASTSKLRRTLHLVNSAVFNRLGFCFSNSSRLLLTSQLLVEDAFEIHFQNNKAYFSQSYPVKSFLMKVSSELNSSLRSTYGSFEPLEFNFSPSYHTHGGLSVMHDPTIRQLIMNSMLFIAGSPSSEKLGIFHHTLFLCRQIKEKTKIFRQA